MFYNIECNYVTLNIHETTTKAIRICFIILKYQTPTALQKRIMLYRQPHIGILFPNFLILVQGNSITSITMIDVMEGRRSCHVFNIDDVLHIINDIYVHQIVKIFYIFCTKFVNKDIIYNINEISSLSK